MFPRDPNVESNAAHVLDLYARTWNGAPLGTDDYVVSADESPGSNKHCAAASPAGWPARPSRTPRVEFEYRRCGTLAYFAAYDIHHARVMGTIAPKTGIEPFPDLVAHVVSRDPYASARRVFWVVVDFADLDALAERILAFQERYNRAATPFDRTFTHRALRALLDPIGPPEQTSALTQRRMTPDELTNSTTRTVDRRRSCRWPRRRRPYTRRAAQCHCSSRCPSRTR